MNNDKGWQIRKNCLTALRQYEESHLKAKQAKETAEGQKKAARLQAQNTHQQMRQRAENLLKEIKGIAHEGDYILQTLSLGPSKVNASSPKTGTPPTGATLDDLGRMLHNQRIQMMEVRKQIKDMADELKQEQLKWWKFW